MQTLELSDLALTPRAVSYLASGLPRLVHLRLASSTTRRSARLNAGGELSMLAGLPGLRELVLENVAGDKGLGELTQLTALTLLLPSHTPSIDAFSPSQLAMYTCVRGGAARARWRPGLPLLLHPRCIPHHPPPLQLPRLWGPARA